MAVRIRVQNSPNQSPRLAGAVRLVICHTPEGSDMGATATIMNPDAEVSYHRLYLKGGEEAIQFVPFHNKAWHAKTYNSLSDGLACSGFAHKFDLHTAEAREFAIGVAERCKERGLKPQWTTDPVKGGFCRHADIQSDRSDPTPDLAEWKEFCKMVKAAYFKEPLGYWDWLAWTLGEGDYKTCGKRNPRCRPEGLPKRVPASWWARRLVFLTNRERQ